MRFKTKGVRLESFRPSRSHVFGCSSKRLLVIILGLLAASIVTANIQTAHGSTNLYAGLSKVQQDSSSVMTAFDAALNAHDVNAGLDLFATDGFVHDESRELWFSLTGYNANNAVTIPPATCGVVGGAFGSIFCRYDGKDRIGEWLRELAAENTQVHAVGNYQVDANNVTWNLGISSDLYHNLGIAQLVSRGVATLQGGRIQSLTLSLSSESISEISLAVQKGRQSVVESSVYLTGIVSLGLILPAAAIYYASRMKSLFGAVPRLERPWLLFQIGLASLFLGLVLILFRDLLGPILWSTLNTIILLASAAIFLLAMVMMKRAWTIPSSE